MSLKKLTDINNNDIQVESAIRDSQGNQINLTYAKKDELTYILDLGEVFYDEVELTPQQFQNLMNADFSQIKFLDSIQFTNHEEQVCSLNKKDETLLILHYSNQYYEVVVQYESTVIAYISSISSSSITPNPSSSSTEQLEKATIGSTVYQVQNIELSDTDYIADIVLQFSDNSSETIEGVLLIENNAIYLEVE